MKKYFYLSLAAIATTFMLASCSQSTPNVDLGEDKGAPALLTVKFDNPTITRASGTPTGESNITSGTILVFRASTGVLDGMGTFTATGVTNVKITAGQRDVYVVANTGLDFSTIANVSQLENLTNKYALTSISATGTALPMSGKTATTVDASAATVASPAQATVTLNYMCSRVKINWDITNLNTSMAGFSVTKVYMMNVPISTDCFATAPDDLTTYTTGFATGLVNPSNFSTGVYYPVFPLTNTYNTALELDPAGTSGDNFFYIFENSNADSPTIVVVEGKVGTTTYYYPIVINGTQNDTGGSGDNTATVVRGKDYSVKAIIKGFGNEDPYDPIIKAALDVTIVAPSWSPVLTIDQTFE